MSSDGRRRLLLNSLENGTHVLFYIILASHPACKGQQLPHRRALSPVLALLLVHPPR